MAFEGLHAPRDRLSDETYTLHQAITSLVEELEAVDWYRQRADDCSDEELKGVLLHNMREEIEHALMNLEWIRRHNTDFAAQMDIYLYAQGSILEAEEEAERRGLDEGT